MEEISFDQIEQIWADNDKPTQLYIHSAFCKSICKYCAYKGHIYDEALYKKYFFEYLPSQIEKYKHIIDSQNIHSIYFGGGTPNTEEDLANLEPIFKLLHNVPCEEKIIEIHTGLPITDKTVEVLKRENFNTVILGVQTFDTEKLASENRIHGANNDIDEIIGKLQKAGINVGMDFIAFPDDKNRIVNDVNKLTLFKNWPDEISIAPLYGSADGENIARFITDLTKYGYELVLPKAHASKSTECLMQQRCWRFIKPEKLDGFADTFYSFIPYLSETASSSDSSYTSCLGIGSTKGMPKQTYSRVGLTRYYEIWDGEKVKYSCKKQTSLKQLLMNTFKDFPDLVPENFKIEIIANNASDSNCSISEGDAQLHVCYTIPDCLAGHLAEEADKLKASLLL